MLEAVMKWIRLWPDYIINGTTFSELDAETRGVWFSLLALAGYSPQPGTICISQGIPYTNEQMAGFLKIPLPILDKAIIRLTSPEVKKLTVNPDKTLSVSNWLKYQTEYERQKPYRRGLQGKVTQKGYEEKLPIDTDTDTEVDTDTEKQILRICKKAKKAPAKAGRSSERSRGFIHPYLQIFTTHYESKFGRPYIIGDYARHNTQAKGLAARVSEFDLLTAVHNFLNDSNEFVVENGHTFPIFVTKINAYLKGEKVKGDW